MDTSAPSESLLPSVSQGNGFLSDSRASGVLLHISSLPSPFGVGDLGSGAFAFVDFLARSGQQYWQVLPLSPTNEIFANSPI